MTTSAEESEKSAVHKKKLEYDDETAVDASCSSSSSNASLCSKSSIASHEEEKKKKKESKSKKPSASPFSSSKNSSTAKQPTVIDIKSRPPAVLPPLQLRHHISGAGSESEHIYESIPDITESEEPVYCIPYQSHEEIKKQQQQQANVLNRKSTSVGSGTNSSSNSSHCSKRSNRKDEDRTSPRNSKRISPKNSILFPTKDVHIREIHKEERDSSSAYNTGDSTGSNPANMKINGGLELSLGQDPALRKSTFTLCPPTLQQHQQTTRQTVVRFIYNYIFFK